MAFLTVSSFSKAIAFQVFALGKPVVLVLVNGGVVAIDNLINPADAIVEVCLSIGLNTFQVCFWVLFFPSPDSHYHMITGE